MGRLLSSEELRGIVLKKICQPRGISLNLLKKLSPRNRRVVFGWIQSQLLDTQKIDAQLFHLEQALNLKI